MEHFIMVMLVTTLRKNASVRFPFSFYRNDKPENQDEGFLWRCERIKKTFTDVISNWFNI